MKHLAIPIACLMIAGIAIYLFSEHKWAIYQEAFASSFKEVQGAVFQYYVRERKAPDNITSLKGNISPATDTFAAQEGWQIYHCTSTNSGYIATDDSDYLCLEMLAPLRAICALEIEKDDGNPAKGMGVSDEIDKDRLNNCRIVGKKRYRYVYHIF
ncbi:MAG: hypothetical protein LBV09_05100 [Deferribacteraceae bacterium]|jgi:hypothetical protein|nr:hypothetical protein [Deferribacteraceae bacterium]